MKKFYILVKKEIRELLTLQMILPLVMVIIVFMFVGKVIGKETTKMQAPLPIAVMDLDISQTSAGVKDILAQSNFKVREYKDANVEQAIAQAKQEQQKALLIIPQGFEQGIQAGIAKPLETYAILTNFSFLGSRASQNMAAAVAAINHAIGRQMLSKAAPGTDINAILQPVKTADFVIIGDRQAQISPAAISGFIASQTTFIPIVLFMVIIFAAQLIAVSIATEKENKTLETLLSSPVSRGSIVAAKLVGAGIVALISSIIYLFGMRSYMNGFTGGVSATIDSATQEAARQLGLTFSTSDYVLLGLSLFLGILAALSVALILGSFAQDVKSAQGVITPLMLLIIIPYFLTMFLDFSSLSPGLRMAIYAIPFSHPFLAAPNLMLNRYDNILYGILYMALFFLAFVALASKIFASDKIMTMNLNFKKKR